MAQRVLATLIVSHRGVPLGRTVLLELEPREPLRVPAQLRAIVPPAPSFAIDGFEPLPGYESVRAIVQRASEAARNLGYLGPVADPESDLRGHAALAALNELLVDLEFRDLEGQLIPVDVFAFDESHSMGETTAVTLAGTIEDATSAVLARLLIPQASDSGQQPPAV
jgi:hypothetical protein